MTEQSLQNSSRCAAALDRLTRYHPKLIDLGLERTLTLSEKMGAPHLKLPPTIHIAGTNGKGSTAAILRALLEAHGYRVHVYSSPHLCRFNERIRLAGELISDEVLADILEQIEEVNGGEAVTFFESTTVAGFTAFAHHPADFLILETGLGGVYDSTNIIPHHACSIITPIAHDHEHFLGTNLAEIASQKAGIMKPDCPSIWAEQAPDAYHALKDAADETGVRTLDIENIDFETSSDSNSASASPYFQYRSERAEFSLPVPALHGSHQIQNAGLALRCLEVLGITSGADRLSTGLQQARWPARIQPLSSGDIVEQSSRECIWLDGAHNAHGAAALAAALRNLSGAQKWVMVYGALNTRPPAQFLTQLAPLTEKIYTLTIPDQPAALDAESLCDIAGEMGIDVQACSDLSSAMRHIASDTARLDLPVIICGSLYLAGHVLNVNNSLPD